MNKNNIILHIPHANTKLPSDMGELLVETEKLINFSTQVSDIDVDNLFNHGIGEKYIAPLSRIYCDVEKYIDDSQEIMSQYGQGVFYTKDCEGNIFRKIDDEYKNKVYNNYYLPYHTGLDNLTLSLLDKKLIIVDCHSFGEKCVLHNKTDSYCDVCIGYDKQYFSEEMIKGVEKIFLTQGYTVSFNSPYNGTLIPNSIYGKSQSNVYCVMIELNKRIYTSKLYQYNKCKQTIKKVLEYLYRFE